MITPLAKRMTLFICSILFPNFPNFKKSFQFRYFKGILFRFILDFATEKQGIVVSRDNYRDIYKVRRVLSSDRYDL